MNLRYLRMVLGYKLLVPVLLVAKKTFSLVDRRADAENVMVNIGGGVFIKRHWKNLDYSSDSYPYKLSYLDYNFDLTSAEPFPFRNGAVKFFYSSHTLEHIPHEFCDHIFGEFYRCLRPGGAVRLTMPDYDKIYEGYRQGRVDFWGVGSSPDEILCRGIATALARKVDAGYFRAKCESLSKAAFGDYVTGLISIESQKAMMSNHCNWWNYDKLHSMLERVGFRKIFRSEPSASQFPEMRAHGSFLGLESFVTLPEVRDFDSSHPTSSVFVEAIK